MNGELEFGAQTVVETAICARNEIWAQRTTIEKLRALNARLEKEVSLEGRAVLNSRIGEQQLEISRLNRLLPKIEGLYEKYNETCKKYQAECVTTNKLAAKLAAIEEHCSRAQEWGLDALVIAEEEIAELKTNFIAYEAEDAPHGEERIEHLKASREKLRTKLAACEADYEAERDANEAHVVISDTKLLEDCTFQWMLARRRRDVTCNSGDYYSGVADGIVLVYAMRAGLASSIAENTIMAEAAKIEKVGKETE